jgi:hypothetical protein
MPLRLHAVISTQSPLPTELPRDTRRLAVRDLAAVVTVQSAFTVGNGVPGELAAHRAIVDQLFLVGPVLPAPPGVVFQSDDVVTRWLTLHYVALADTLGFVEDRVAARVHICWNTECDPKSEMGTKLAAAAAAAAQSLRRRAVAAIPLRVEHFTGIMTSSAYLVERELWNEFGSAVEAVQREHAGLRFELSGPWPPYDFVQMQFSA